MSYLPPPPEDVNPFRAPAARIGDYRHDLGEIERGGDAEVIRSEHINHEVSIRTLGILHYIGAVFGAIGTVGCSSWGSGLVPLDPGNRANQENISPELLRGLFLGFAVFCLALTVLNGFLGYGLRALQVWARWTIIVLWTLSLLYVLAVSLLVAITQPAVGLFTMGIGGLVPGYILYLMASPKASMVFSAEYKDVIRKTPHVRSRTSLLVKIVLVLLVAVIVFIVIAALMSANK